MECPDVDVGETKERRRLMMVWSPKLGNWKLRQFIVFTPTQRKWTYVVFKSQYWQLWEFASFFAFLNARTVAKATQMTQIRKSWIKKSSKTQCNNTLKCNTFIPPFWWVKIYFYKIQCRKGLEGVNIVHNL